MSSFSSCSSCATTVQLDLTDDCDLESLLSEHSIYTVSSTEMEDCKTRSSSPEVIPNYQLAFHVEREYNSMLTKAKTALEPSVGKLERELLPEKARYALLVPQVENGNVNSQHEEKTISNDDHQQHSDSVPRILYGMK